MGAPCFKDYLAADISATFLNGLEFSEKHMLNGKKMTAQVDENELLERDKARLGTHTEGLYKSRRLVYVARADFGPRPAINTMLNLDGRIFKITDCTEEAGVLAITLEDNRS